MQLSSLYDYFQRKYKSASDQDLRKRLLSFPEYQMIHLADHTLVIEDAISGMKVLQLNDISGLTFTTALDTLAIPRKSDPLTVARYFEEKGKKLDHPDVPMLAVRKDLRSGARMHYDFLPLERVFYRESTPSASFQVGSECSTDDEDSELEKLMLKFTDKPVNQGSLARPLTMKIPQRSGWTPPTPLSSPATTELESLYDYYQRKFFATDDQNLRKQLRNFKECNLADLATITLIRPDPETGLILVEHHRIEGFTHTNAKDTVAKSDGLWPITVKQYYEDFEETLLHPELPLLAVRSDPMLQGDDLEYEYLLLERVYHRKPRGVPEEKRSQEDEDDVGPERAPIQEEAKEPARPTDKQTGKIGSANAPAGRGRLMGRGGLRIIIPRF